MSSNWRNEYYPEHGKFLWPDFDGELWPASSSGLNTLDDKIYFYPFVLNRRLSSLGATVMQRRDNASAQIGLYNSRSDGTPNKLLTDTVWSMGQWSKQNTYRLAQWGASTPGGEGEEITIGPGVFWLAIKKIANVGWYPGITDTIPNWMGRPQAANENNLFVAQMLCMESGIIPEQVDEEDLLVFFNESNSFHCIPPVLLQVTETAK